MKNQTFNPETRIFSAKYDSVKLSKNEVISAVESAGNFQVINWKVVK